MMIPERGENAATYLNTTDLNFANGSTVTLYTEQSAIRKETSRPYASWFVVATKYL